MVIGIAILLRSCLHDKVTVGYQDAKLLCVEASQADQPTLTQLLRLKNHRSYLSALKTYVSFCAEDKKRFEDQLQAHPKLAALVETHNQQKQDLKALKKGKGKGSKPSTGTKKRSRQQESPASDDEVCTCAKSM